MNNQNIRNAGMNASNMLGLVATSLDTVGNSINQLGSDVASAIENLEIRTASLSDDNHMTGSLRLGPLTLYGIGTLRRLHVCGACGLEHVQTGMEVAGGLHVCQTCTRNLFAGLLNQLVVSQNDKTLLLQREGSADQIRSVGYNCWTADPTWCIRTKDEEPNFRVLPNRTTVGKHGYASVCDLCAHQLACISGNESQPVLRPEHLAPDLQEKLA